MQLPLFCSLRFSSILIFRQSSSVFGISRFLVSGMKKHRQKLSKVRPEKTPKVNVTPKWFDWRKERALLCAKMFLDICRWCHFLTRRLSSKDRLFYSESEFRIPYETYQLLGEGRHNGRESRTKTAGPDAELANDGREAFDAAYEDLGELKEE